MSIPLPPLNLSGQSASESGQSTGDTFNFAPPPAKSSNIAIYAIVGVSVLGVAFFAFRGR